MKEKKKPEKSTKNSKGKNSHLLKYTILFLILITAGYYIYVAYFKGYEKEQDYTLSTDRTEQFKNIQEPQFKKEGELQFLKKDGSLIEKIDIEVADNEPERRQGLMYRRTMDENRGMLFIFPQEELQDFWMKNTIMSLDIIYVNKNKEIVKIHKNTIPFSEASVPSIKPAIYVVEVNAGHTDKLGIKEGDRIEFSYK